MNKPADVDTYIASFPPDIQQKLSALRATIKAAAPDAQEGISYGMPAYKLNGALVYFAAHTKHIGVYAMPAATEHFAKELTDYTCTKGTVQLPFDKPMPLELIAGMTEYNIARNLVKVLKKKK